MIGGEPKLGHVFRYCYDWQNKQDIKEDRPCLLAFKMRIKDKHAVYCMPITSKKPQHQHYAEIPTLIAQRLGLNSNTPSYIVYNELNSFEWVGFDVRPVKNKTPESIYYGEIPSKFYETITQKFFLLKEAGDIRITTRL